MTKNLTIGAILVLAVAAVAGIRLITSESGSSEWGVRWVERVDDDQIVVLWRKEGDVTTSRMSLINLADGSVTRTIEDEGTHRVIRKTPGVLWMRHQSGIFAIELPELIRHRVHASVRAHPHLSSGFAIQGTTIDRLVLQDAEHRSYTVSTDGTVEPLPEDTHVDELANASGDDEIREPFGPDAPWEGDMLTGLDLERPAYVREAGRPVMLDDDTALVVGRIGGGPSEAHVLAALQRDGTLRWTQACGELLGEGAEGPTRLIWASVDGSHAVLSSRLYHPRTDAEDAFATYANTLVRLDPATGAPQRISLATGSVE